MDQLKVATLVNAKGEIVRRWHHIRNVGFEQHGAQKLTMWRITSGALDDSGHFWGVAEVVAYICPSPGMYIDIKPELGTPEEIVARIAEEEDAEAGRPYAADQDAPHAS